MGEAMKGTKDTVPPKILIFFYIIDLFLTAIVIANQYEVKIIKQLTVGKVLICQGWILSLIYVIFSKPETTQNKIITGRLKMCIWCTMWASNIKLINHYDSDTEQL